MGRKKKYKTKQERIDAKHQSQKKLRLKKKIEENRRCKKCKVLITELKKVNNSNFYSRNTGLCRACLFAKQKGFKKTEDYFEHKIQEKQEEVNKVKRRYKDYLKLKQESGNSSQP